MSNTTVPIFGGGPEIIQDGDFFQSAGILHPLIIGTIAIAILFAYLRVSSNRSVAPMTVFDWIISVAIGSTLAGVVNGTALVRGAIAMAVLLFWQFITSYLAMRFPGKATTLLTSPALIIAYRGRPLKEVMSAHRISGSDLSSALRCAGVWHIKEVEVVIIEPTGKFNVYLRKDYPKDYEPEVLLQLDAYRALIEHDDEHADSNGKNCSGKDGEDAVKEQDQQLSKDIINVKFDSSMTPWRRNESLNRYSIKDTVPYPTTGAAAETMHLNKLPGRVLPRNRFDRYHPANGTNRAFTFYNTEDTSQQRSQAA